MKGAASPLLKHKVCGLFQGHTLIRQLILNLIKQFPPLSSNLELFSAWAPPGQCKKIALSMIMTHFNYPSEHLLAIFPIRLLWPILPHLADEESEVPKWFSCLTPSPKLTCHRAWTLLSSQMVTFSLKLNSKCLGLGINRWDDDCLSTLRSSLKDLRMSSFDDKSFLILDIIWHYGSPPEALQKPEVPGTEAGMHQGWKTFLRSNLFAWERFTFLQPTASRESGVETPPGNLLVSMSASLSW